jgi:uncharacterized protein
MRLLPREEHFFELFNDLSGCLTQGASQLHALLKDVESAQIEVQVQRLKDIEHQGDEITHNLLTKLNRTFITPLDREDIHRLASALDDVLDYVYSSGERLVMCDIRTFSQPAAEIASIIGLQCAQISSALGSLDNHEHVLACCREINRLEKDADRVYRSAVASLFKQERDAINLIKMKELFEFLETATDKAKDAGNVLESVVLKNS